MFLSLTERVQKILKDQYDLDDVSVHWQRPQESSHGDSATAVALQIAKKAGKKPQEIAQVLVDALQKLETVERCEVAGPGYVNVWLTTSALIAELSKTREACTPRVKRKDEAPVIVEYSGPNIAKPLGIHHVMSTVIGQAIANLYDYQGYNVVKVNYIGDWGTQFGKLFVAFRTWATKPVEECDIEDLLDMYVRFHEEAEKDSTLEDEARAAFALLEKGDDEMSTFRLAAVDISMKALLKMYERLGVTIEHQHGESLYEDLMKPVLDIGKEKGVFTEGKEGALIAEFPEDSHMPPAIVLKGDGATIYHTRDLAAIRYRTDRWHPQAVYHVVDVAQELYFKQLIAMGNMLWDDLPTWEHIIFGRMRFVDKNMSTRKGNMLRLEHVLDEAVERAKKIIDEHGESIQTDNKEDLAEMMGVGSVAYGTLSQNRRMDMIFDWDKMLSFDGNSAPYLQYTHARAKSVLRKGGEFTEPTDITNFAGKERQLLNTLLQFERILEEARATHMPHTLCNYLFALCQDYNAFYNDTPILKAEEPQRSLRLSLTSLTTTVLKVGAEILTLRVPDRM
ncbi:MAG: arginine--tRNA ligase [bacterium]|nr:arginine--tRNA ligase [bacterium]